MYIVALNNNRVFQLNLQNLRNKSHVVNWVGFVFWFGLKNNFHFWTRMNFFHWNMTLFKSYRYFPSSPFIICSSSFILLFRLSLLTDKHCLRRNIVMYTRHAHNTVSDDEIDGDGNGGQNLTHNDVKFFVSGWFNEYGNL